MNARIVCCLVTLLLTSACAAQPYRVSGLTAIAYSETEASNSSAMAPSQVNAFLTRYLVNVRGKLPSDVGGRRTWNVGEGNGGVIEAYVTGMQQAREANPKTRLSRFVGNAISPVIADPDAYPAWVTPGVEMQFIGYDNEVTAILVMNPNRKQVYFVPAPTAASVLSGFFCIGRPIGGVEHKTCETCGADLIAQPFERTDGVVFFPPNETEGQRRRHLDVGEPRHMGGQPLSTECDIHNKKAGEPCVEQPGTPGPANK